MQKIIISICLLVLFAIACKKAADPADAAPEISYSGDAYIYSSIKFKSNRAGSTLRWDFGDNMTSIDKEATHQYAKEGKYTIKLTIDGKETISREIYITLGLERIGKQRSWSRKLIKGSQTTMLPDTSFALAMTTDEVAALPPQKSISFFNNNVEVYYQKVEEHLIFYYSNDTATKTINNLRYNAIADLVTINRVYEQGYDSYNLQYSSK